MVEISAMPAEDCVRRRIVNLTLDVKIVSVVEPILLRHNAREIDFNVVPNYRCRGRLNF
jgi:hypothetical protein